MAHALRADGMGAAGGALCLTSPLLTIVGYAVNGPSGALIGGLLGDIFFPPEAAKGPRLNELNVQHSTVGAPIPIVYGTAAARRQCHLVRWAH